MDFEYVSMHAHALLLDPSQKLSVEPTGSDVPTSHEVSAYPMEAFLDDIPCPRSLAADLDLCHSPVEEIEETPYLDAAVGCDQDPPESVMEVELIPGPGRLDDPFNASPGTPKSELALADLPTPGKIGPKALAATLGEAEKPREIVDAVSCRHSCED